MCRPVILCRYSRETLGELLRAFFRYYGFEFNYRDEVVCLRLGHPISKAEKGWSNDDVLRRKEERQLARERAAKQAEEEAAARVLNGQTPAEGGAGALGARDALDDDEDEEDDDDGHDGRDGGTGEDGRPKKASKRRIMDRFWFCVEDPFETSHNLGRVVRKDTLYEVRGEFMRAYRMLNRGASLAAVCEPHPERAGLSERSRRRANERDRPKQELPPAEPLPELDPADLAGHSD